MSTLLAFTCIIVSSPSALAAETNLVLNGSFEEPVTGTVWKLAQGPNIEVQYGNAGQPYDENKHVELDGNAVSKIYQDIPTEVGKTYKLTFAFSARPGVADNKLNVYWGNTLVAKLSKNGKGIADTDWEPYTYDDLKATSTSTRLSFDNLNEKSDTLGSYIDDIRVTDSSKPGKNLVVNGSFETPVIKAGVEYLSSFLGWKLSAGPAIEIMNPPQAGVVGAAKDGGQLVELDSRAVSKIFQDIPTKPGKTYTLTFAFSPRPDVAENKLNVSWGDTKVVQLDKSGEGIGDTVWQVYTYNLKATGNITRLSFDNLDETSNTVGSFIDSVSLVESVTPCF